MIYRETSNTLNRTSIDVLIRRSPATIWNEYHEGLWEMTWVQNREKQGRIPGPRHRILHKLEDYLDIVSPHFIEQPPYTGCGIRMPWRTRRSFVFEGLADLKTKTERTMPRMESWRNMLMSQRLIDHLEVEFCIDVRYGARSFLHGGQIGSEFAFRDGREMKMGDLVNSLQSGLEVMWKVLEEIQGYIVPARDFKPGIAL